MVHVLCASVMRAEEVNLLSVAAWFLCSVTGVHTKSEHTHTSKSPPPRLTEFRDGVGSIGRVEVTAAGDGVLGGVGRVAAAA